MSRGRGRGRGRGKPFAGMEGIGLAPGEAAPPPILRPPPLFPILERKPLELKIDDISCYLHSIKQEFRQYMKQSPFHLKSNQTKANSVNRYSDKYSKRNNDRLEDALPWRIEPGFFPEELQPKRPVKRGNKVVKVKSKKPKKQKLDNKMDDVTSKKKHKVTFDSDTITPKKGEELKKLKELEKSEAGEGQGSEEEAISDEEEFYDEEIEEEGTDYNQTYFDNGEDFVEEDNLEENEGPYY